MALDEKDVEHKVTPEWEAAIRKMADAHTNQRFLTCNTRRPNVSLWSRFCNMFKRNTNK
jgi:hypothetical protein